MKLTILKQNLKEGLSVVERVVAKSSSLPILQNILLVAKDNFLELLATDLEVGIRYRVLAQIEESGTIVVPAHSLSQFIGLLPEDKIALSVSQAGLSIRAKGYTTIIKTLQAEDFPIVPQPKETEKAFHMDTRELTGALERVVSTAGQSSARPEISGIFFYFHNKKAIFAATDSFRLGEVSLSLGKEGGPASPTSQGGQDIHFILPPKTARELIAVFGERSGEINIFISPTQAVFDYVPETEHIGAHIQVVSRLIEGEYPNYQDVIPKNHSATITADKAEVMKRVKAASIFSGKLSDAVLRADPSKKGIEIISQSADVGENTSFLEAQVEGELSEARFNWRFLLEGMTHIKGKTLIMGLGGPDAPATLRSADPEGYLYVVMPIRS